MLRPTHTHAPAVGPIMTCPRCRLDMAAPELLAALRLCLAYVPADGDNERDAREAAEDAIRKATGEEE